MATKLFTIIKKIARNNLKQTPTYGGSCEPTHPTVQGPHPTGCTPLTVGFHTHTTTTVSFPGYSNTPNRHTVVDHAVTHLFFSS